MQLTVGNEYFNAMEEYKEGMRAGMKGYLLMGKAITTLKNKQLWRQEGGHVRSFGHFCKQVLHISPAQAHRTSQVWRELGPILSRPDMGMDITKITLLLPLVKDQSPEKKEELLLMARDLSIEDVRNNILDMRGCSELATDVCLHEETESMLRCLKCNKWLK